MKIEIYKCDYCHKKVDEPRKLIDLFGFDSCKKCSNDFWWGLKDALSEDLISFVFGKRDDVKFKGDYFTCNKCGTRSGHVEKVGYEHYPLQQIKLKYSFSLCPDCSDKLIKKFKKTAILFLDRFRIKYKKNDVVKFLGIYEVFEYSNTRLEKL